MRRSVSEATKRGREALCADRHVGPGDVEAVVITEIGISDASMKQIPARRFGNAQEFGAICAFLCSQHAGYMTGQNILPDGGLYPGSF